jgi:hypothetical protein
MARMKVDTPRQEARVLPFQRPGPADVQQKGPSPVSPASLQAPAAGLERYERPEGADDDYRHRMIVNATVLAVCALLGAAGIWVAISIADLRRNQDCVLAGRKNCAGLSIPSGANLIGEQKAAPKPLPAN